MTTNDLYGVAEQECVEITPYRLQKRDALSLIDEDGRCYIAIDPTKITSGADEKTKIAHELGHCVTGSFYNVYSSCDFRQRHEARADKWAIKRLLPEDELHDAVANDRSRSQSGELVQIRKFIFRLKLVRFKKEKLSEIIEEPNR